MADDWKPGDPALCVKDGRCPVRQNDLPIRKGRIYTVAAVGMKDSDAGIPTLVLGLAGVRGGSLGVNHICFRKIKPLTDEERDEFTADLNTPVLEPARHVRALIENSHD